MPHLQSCPKCQSKDFVKNGRLHGRQRYRCRVCGYNFSVAKLGKVKPPEVQRKALQLYLEGMSFRGIEGVLGDSHVTVLKWVCRWGQKIAALRREGEPKEVVQVEVDEWWAYVGAKKSESGYGCVWIEGGGQCWILWWESEASGRVGSYTSD